MLNYKKESVGDQYIKLDKPYSDSQELLLDDSKWLQSRQYLQIDNITEKLGTSSDTIKIVKNFISKEDLDKVMILCDFMYKDKFFRRHKITEAENTIREYRIKIKEKAEDLFKLKLEYDDIANKNNIESNYLNGRQPNHLTDIHADCLGDNDEHRRKYSWSGHISNLIYLNDDYSGGELYFPNHNLKIKPETGMLISFPGNWFNRHAILPASSLRLAINMFLKISDFDKST